MTIYVSAFVTPNCAFTVAETPSLPVIVMVSLYVPTASPTFGVTVNVAVPPAGRFEADKPPITKCVDVGWFNVTEVTPTFVTVTVCDNGAVYPADSVPKKFNAVAEIVGTVAIGSNTAVMVTFSERIPNTFPCASVSAMLLTFSDPAFSL